MPKKTNATLHENANAPRDGHAPAAQPKSAISAVLLKRPLTVPERSMKKAESKFKHFSLSKFTDGAAPSNYLPTEKKSVKAPHVPSAVRVQDVQRKRIEQHLHKLSKSDAPNRAMTLALPAATMKTLLPSYNEKAGTIDLNDVMTLIVKHTRERSFNGGQSDLPRPQARVQQIMNSIKQ